MNASFCRVPPILPRAGIRGGGVAALLIWLVALSFISALAACSKPSSDKGKSTNAAGQGNARGGKGGKRGEGGEKAKEFLTPVVVERIGRGPLLVTVTATANVIPVRSETVQTMESGIVVYAKAWREGQEVTSGTLVATLDNEDLRKQHETALADMELQRQTIEIQRIRLRQQEREYVIIQDLYARGLAPLKDVESAKLQLENARNNLRQAKINLEKSELSLAGLKRRFDYLDIRAPFTGMLVSRSTIEGRSGMAKTFGSEPLRSLDGRFVGRSTDLFGILDISSIYLKCDITSKDIAKVRIGAKAYGIVYARENIEVQGEVVSVSANVNPDTRAFDVHVLIPNHDGRLLPGMFGRVEIVVQELFDVIAIPKNIVQRRGERDVVFVVDRPPALPHPVARQVEVELGVESKDLVEAIDGLRKDDEVVVRGYEILRDQIPLTVSAADEPTT